MLEERNKLLVLIDDVYPDRLSSFRNEEFDNYIELFNDVLIINISNRIIELDCSKFKNKNVYYFQTDDPGSNESILKIINKYDIKISPIVFINNIYKDNQKILLFLENNNIRFLLTLYPGGGFFLNKETELKLKRIFSSPTFYKVIVTQTKSRDFLLSKKLVDENKIEYIYGVVTSKKFLNMDLSDHKYYKRNNIYLNICFVAYKYSQNGKDKGYDTFIRIAKRLVKKYRNVYFHVVGNFDETDYNIDELYERIAFYGIHDSDWFIDFYRDKDIIISPTRKSILKKGAFDGFPTGATTDAMLNGVMAIVTDPMNLNQYYKNNKNIIIVNNDLDNIEKTICKLIKKTRKRIKIAKRGYKQANSIYNYEYQMNKRIDLLKEMEN